MNLSERKLTAGDGLLVRREVQKNESLTLIDLSANDEYFRSNTDMLKLKGEIISVSKKRGIKVLCDHGVSRSIVLPSLREVPNRKQVEYKKRKTAAIRKVEQTAILCAITGVEEQILKRKQQYKEKSNWRRELMLEYKRKRQSESTGGDFKIK